MAANHLEALLEASSKILVDTAQLEFKHEAPFLKDHFFNSHEISVLVGLSGDFEGAIIFSLAPDAALSLAGRFMEVMGVPPSSDLNDEAKSALAELVNTIMGHYMIAMETRGQRVNITPVTLVTGSEINFGVDGIKQVVAVPMQLSAGPAEINIALK